MNMRLVDWQSRLSQVIRTHQEGQFKWGDRDCCLFVCEAITALTGIDVGEPFRGTYSTMTDGYEQIKKFCGGGVEELADTIAKERGFEEIPPVMAQRGDVGLYRDPTTGPSLGVCIGSRFGFLVEKGMYYVSMSKIERAWRI